MWLWLLWSVLASAGLALLARRLAASGQASVDSRFRNGSLLMQGVLVPALGLLRRAMRSSLWPLTPEDLLRRARAACPDLPPEATQPSPELAAALPKLCEALNGEARLHEPARMMQTERLAGLLSNSLRLEHEWASSPAIQAEVIERPLVIVSLARSGTTMLQRLLAADSASFHSLKSWEALNPATPPAGQADRRIAFAKTASQALRLLAPNFFAIHPIDPLAVEEEILLLDLNLHSQVAEALVPVPSFGRWLETQDPKPAYELMKRALQVLQHQKRTRGGEGRLRWILKTPMHMEHLGVLLEVFPDSLVLQTHRTPQQCVPSFLSMVAHSFAIFSERVSAAEVAAHWMRKMGIMMQKCFAARDSLPEEVQRRQFLDIHYRELMERPLEVAQRIYEFAGIPWSELSAGRLQAHLGNAAHKQNRFGVHRYSAKDFGLTEDQVCEPFREYIQRFGL